MCISLYKHKKRFRLRFLWKGISLIKQEYRFGKADVFYLAKGS